MSRMIHPELRPPDELAHREFELIVRRLADDLAFGSDASPFVGSGIEFAQTRPYVPGDPIKQLDWKVLARTGKPHTKEYEALKRVPAYLVVDTSASMSAGSMSMTKHDLAVWLAAAIGLVALSRLSPVALVSGGARDHRATPSLLRSDLWKAVEPLRKHGTEEQTNLGRRIRRLSVAADRVSMFIVLSDLHDPDAADAIKLAAQRHDVAVVQLQDPAERGRLGIGFTRSAEAETGAEFIGTSRTRWFQGRDDGFGPEFRAAGIDHLLLRINEPFVTPVRQFLFSRALKGRRS